MKRKLFILAATAVISLTTQVTTWAATNQTSVTTSTYDPSTEHYIGDVSNTAPDSVFHPDKGKEPTVQAGKIYLSVNNQPISTDVDPYLENGRTMVPIRFVMEALGGKVTWNESDLSVTIERKGIKIFMKIGDNQAKVGDKTIELEAAPILTGGRTFIPVRFVGENLGAKVVWDDNYVGIAKNVEVTLKD